MAEALKPVDDLADAVVKLESADVAIGLTGRISAEAVEAAGGVVNRALEARPGIAAAIVVAPSFGPDGVQIPVQLAPNGGPHRFLVAALDEPRKPSATTPSPSDSLRSIFETARRLGVRALLVIDGEGAAAAPESIGGLLDGVLVHGLDYVAPYYRRQRLAGAVTRSIVYPLVRALYGRQIRYPIGADFACSVAMLDRFLARPGWSQEPTRIGVELLLTTEALCSNLRVGQAVIPTLPPVTAEPGDDLSTVVAGVLRPAFGDMERRVPAWQRVRASERVTLIGSPTPLEPDRAPFDGAAMLDAFRLGRESLREVWATVLPPTTLLELKHVALGSTAGRRWFGDALWARVVYDFALAYHARSMSRDHLLAAFTPLYLGWFGSFVLEMQDAASSRIEQRVEQLCLQYEAEKAYLISRWRWPDRFNS